MGSLPINKSLPIGRPVPANPAEHKVKQQERLRSAAQMYEEHFLNTLVTQMRKTVPESELMKDSFAGKYFKNKLDQDYVKTWTQKGGIGLADLIYDQMQEKIFGSQNNLPPIKGPLPTEPRSFHNVPKDKSTSESQFKVIDSPPVDQSKGMNYLFQKDIAGNGATLTAPWSGSVKDIQTVGKHHFIKLDHQKGVESLLNFNGELKSLKLGDALQAGQELGELSPMSNSFLWGVRLRS